MKVLCSVAAAACLPLVLACATPGPASAPTPRLVVVHGQFEHEVLVTGPGRQDVLRGVLTFTASNAYALHASTPFGMSLFQVGRAAGRSSSELAEPLKGKLPIKKLEQDVWRIYFAACPGSAQSCVFEGSQLEEQRSPAGVIVSRTLRDPDGRVSVIEYLDWRSMKGILHPETIRLRSGDWGVRIHVVGYEAPAADSSTRR